ncbi:MAG: IPTL-CTERM sorting domain-containing protein [Casimicrobiaceae bacterium]
MKRLLLASMSFMLGGQFVAFAAEAASYNPVGPQTNVSASTVTGGGWAECYRDLYSFQTLDPNTVLSACQGDQLMLACRVTGSATLTLLAQGNRADVTFDTGDNADQLHSANGVGWYFNQSGTDSWGFVRDGDTVAKNNCDVDGSGANDQRLCWHLNPPNGGYRCGVTEGLNDSSAWERIVYVSRVNVAAAIPTLSQWGLILLAVLAAAGAWFGFTRQRRAA